MKAHPIEGSGKRAGADFLLAIRIRVPQFAKLWNSGIL